MRWNPKKKVSKGVRCKFRKVRGQKLGGDWLAFERVNRLFNLMTAQAKA